MVGFHGIRQFLFSRGTPQRESLVKSAAGMVGSHGIQQFLRKCVFPVHTGMRSPGARSQKPAKRRERTRGGIREGAAGVTAAAFPAPEKHRIPGKKPPSVTRGNFFSGVTRVSKCLTGRLGVFTERAGSRRDAFWACGF